MVIGDKFYNIGNNCMLTIHSSYFCFYFSPKRSNTPQALFQTEQIKVILAKIATYNGGVLLSPGV